MRRPFSPSGARIATVAIALVLAGCERPADDAGHAGAAQTTEAEHRERARGAYDAYAAALVDGDAEAAASLYTDDAWIRGEGAFESVRGRGDFQGLVEEVLDGASFEALDVNVEDVIVLGDHVYESGTYTESFRVEGMDEPVEIRGGYAALWRQVEPGIWQIHRFIWNELPAED